MRARVHTLTYTILLLSLRETDECFTISFYNTNVEMVLNRVSDLQYFQTSNACNDDVVIIKTILIKIFTETFFIEEEI